MNRKLRRVSGVLAVGLALGALSAVAPAVAAPGTAPTAAPTTSTGTSPAAPDDFQWRYKRAFSSTYACEQYAVGLLNNPHYKAYACRPRWDEPGVELWILSDVPLPFAVSLRQESAVPFPL
ncbi:hypothetical protein [Embleya sp. NPDC020630]|uniref:hypothetical protein n=1 Tax=Embleya sp. NPDC020630 TaxID=3363979 RepID=UPI0037AE1A39